MGTGIQWGLRHTFQQQSSFNSRKLSSFKNPKNLKKKQDQEGNILPQSPLYVHS